MRADPPGKQLLLIEPDTSSAAFMRHMLTRAGYQVTYAPSGKEGLIAAWRDLPDVIVLELDLPDIDGLEVVRKLRGDTRTDRKRILTLTERSDPADNSQALEAGVDHFIVKQADAVDLLLRTLAQEGEVTEREGGSKPLRPGLVIAFLGAKGGVGTSTLCLNLAHTLSEETKSRTVVVDLVLPIGFLAHITGGHSPIDIVHLTTEVEAGQLTPEYLRTNLKSPKSWGFRLIPGAGDPAQGAKLNAERLAPVLQTLRSTFDFVIVDLGRTLSPLTQLVLRQTAVAVMVLSPTPAVVTSTGAVLHYLEGQGIPNDRFYLLSNRPVGAEDMPIEEVDKALSRPTDAAIPHLGANMTLSNRLLAPLSLRFPDEAGTARVAQVARQILTRLEVEPLPGQG